MGPRLWLSRWCRGYRKACEDVFHLKCPCPISGALNPFSWLGYRCICIGGLLSLPCSCLGVFTKWIIEDTWHGMCGNPLKEPSSSLYSSHAMYNFVVVWCEILLVYNPAPNLESQRVFTPCPTIYSRRMITRVLEVLSLVAPGESHYLKWNRSHHCTSTPILGNLSMPTSYAPQTRILGQCTIFLMSFKTLESFFFSIQSYPSSSSQGSSSDSKSANSPPA